MRDFIALRIARALFITAAAVAALGAALYAAVPMALAPSMRELLVGSCLAFTLACAVAAARLRSANLTRLVLGMGWLLLLLVGVLSFGLGEGVSSLYHGYVVVTVCMVAVLVSRRAALALAGGAVLLALLLAAAEAGGWLPGGAELPRRPLPLRLLSLALVIATGTLVATTITHIVARQVREVEQRGRRFAALLRIAADWYWELDEQLRFSKVSEEFAGASGLAAETRIGKHPWQLPIGLSDDALDAHHADLEAHRPFHDLIARRPRADGGVRFVSISGETRFDERGIFRGYWGVGRDVTDEVRLRQAREASELRYRELFDRSLSALVLHRNGKVLDANVAAQQLFGYGDLAAMRGCNLLDHYPDPEQRARTAARLRQMETMPIGSSLPVADFVVRSVDGRRMLVNVRSVSVDAAGGPAALSIYADETERRSAENALRGSQELLAKVLATSPDLIALTETASGRFVMVNDSFTRLLGYSAAETIGRSSAQLGTWHHAADRARLVEAIGRHGQVQNVALSFVAKSGVAVPMLVSAAGFEFDGRGYLVINARDVSASERARLEREVMFDNASIGIAFTRGQRFVQANPRFEQMFGFAPGTLAGRPGSVVWGSGAEYAEIGRSYGPRLAQGLPVEFERSRLNADGTLSWFRVLGKAVDPSHPIAGGTVWICEDITERRGVEQAMQQARDAAEAASRAKSAFLANTSHELRTPLNGLLGLARLSQRPELDPQRRREYIDQIAASAQSLADIIADILDLSKIEAGKLSVEAVPFDLAATVRALHRAYLELAQARSLALTLEIDGDVPAMVCGDPVRTRQILSNYVTNALKFTVEGGVHIAVSRTRGGEVRVAVRDSGPGIDAATRARLFHPFTQADGSTTRRYGGTGLGLSICRELATLMGGRVGVDSEPGHGSLFWAELPLPETDEADPVSGFGGLDERALAGTRVLVVEDNAVNMMICVALLEQHGVRVAQANNGREAIDAVNAAAHNGDPFDAVLMDVQMPVMSGHEATRVLRQRHDASALPIIALTAAALVSEREQALAAGMNDFLTKPIEPKRLLRSLARALSQPA